MWPCMVCPVFCVIDKYDMISTISSRLFKFRLFISLCKKERKKLIVLFRIIFYHCKPNYRIFYLMIALHFTKLLMLPLINLSIYFRYLFTFYLGIDFYYLTSRHAYL